MTAITLLTDFGLKDGNVGVMKGVIWSIAPGVSIADLSHLISPQNVHEAAIVLNRSAPYFPDGTIHVVVVDPGVGTERRPIATRVGSHYFVGPDNGVITLLLERIESFGYPTSFIHLNKPEFWLPSISNVFHGRDIFAPIAGHLATGKSLHQLGDQITEIKRLHFPKPSQINERLRAEVIHIDHFGNISTNIFQEHLDQSSSPVVSLCGARINGLVKTFGSEAPGTLIALFGSTGNLIVSVVNGNAAQRLGAKVGDIVEVRYPQTRH